MNIEVFDINVIVDDEQMCYRFWPQVPRVGDEMYIYPHKDQATRILIEKVIWGTNDGSADLTKKKCVVTICCKMLYHEKM